MNEAPEPIVPTLSDVEEIRRLLAGTPLAAELRSDAQLDASIEQFLSGHSIGEDLWVFAYGSLIWNPSFPWLERRTARLHGYHRSLCLWSRINRGTPREPGLVLALDRGGSCFGVAYRVAAGELEAVLRRLWRREMLLGSYRPAWVGVETAAGRVRALAFVINRRSSGYAGRLAEEHILRALSSARGRYGAASEYVHSTVEGLARHGIRDARLARLAEKLLLGARAGAQSGD